MTVIFYNGRKKVYTIQTNSINWAINLIDSDGVVWTRYKIK